MAYMQPRPLTPRERSVLDALLTAADFEGADALRQQAGAVQVVGVCGCGCPSIDFTEGGGSGMTVRVDAGVREPESGGLFLYTIEDEPLGEVLGGIEWVGSTENDSPDELPAPEDLTAIRSA